MTINHNIVLAILILNTNTIESGKISCIRKIGDFMETIIALYCFREKVLAKLKLTAQSDLDPGVETDEQLWGLIKK